MTTSPDPAFVEDAEYDRRLTRFTYTPGLGSQHLLLESVQLPTPTLPDGTSSEPVTTRFPDYDDRGRKLRIIAPNGLQIVNAYVGAGDGAREGYLTSTTFDPGGEDITKGAEPDELGRAVRVFRPSFFDAHDDRFFSTFEYDELSQIVRSTSTAPFSIATSNRYDRAGNVARSEMDLKDEANASVGSVVTVSRYDEELHLIRRTVGAGDGADEVKRTITLFDQAARPYLTIEPSGRKRKSFFNERSLVGKTVEDLGGVHAVTRSFYDADGRLVRILDPRGAATRMRYDALGRLVDTEDALGNRVIRHFDKLGNLRVECRYGKVSADQFLLLARREFVYDELGRLIIGGANQFAEPPSITGDELAQAFASSGPGQLLTVQVFHDNVGNLIKHIDQEGRARVSEHDLLGRVTRKIDPDENEVRFRYDKEGNVVRVDRQELTRDPEDGSVVSTRHFAEIFAYDELNRLVERTTSTGRLSYQYDSRGNPVVVHDALGNESRNGYDVFGRLIENAQLLHRHQPGDVPVPVTTAFTYDLDDRKTSHTDPLGRVTRFRYDSAGRPSSTVLPDESVDASTYDRAGNLTGYDDRNGLRRQLDWDPLNRPTALRVDATALDPGAAFAGSTTYHASYDGLGRFTRVEDDFVVNEYAYDSVDHVLEETMSFTPVTGVDPARRFSVGRAFSNSGVLTELTYPSGRTIQYRRDPLDRLLEVRQVARGAAYPGDPATPEGVTLATFAFDGLQLVRIARANGVTTSCGYDVSGRTVAVNHAVGPTSVLTLQLLHDATGNVRQRTQSGQDLQRTDSFRYDSLSRLFEGDTSGTAVLLDLSSIAPSSSPLPDPLPDRQPEIDALLSPAGAQHLVIYDLDVSGNRISRTLDGSVEAYVKNDLDQYTEVDSVARRYDRNGNLAEDDTFRYAYDHRDQVTSVLRKADGQRIEIQRDYFGRRCLQGSGAEIELTVYAGRNVLEQYEADTLRRSVVFAAEAQDVLVSASGGHDLHLVSEPGGSVRYVFDGADKLTFYDYDEFGNLRHPSPADDNPFRFAGKRLMGDTGLYDFGSRAYDPATGRFIQRDPGGYVDGSNLYAYCRNNPLTFSDPDGLESRPEQTVNTGLYTGRAVNTPLDRSGRPLKGQYNLWSGPTGHAQAKGAPGWIMEQTPQHAAAEALEQDFHTKNPGQRMPRDVFEDIWVDRSRTVARKAVLAGQPVAPWGLDTHPNPTATVQFQHEIPTVQRWGSVSAFGMKVGALANLWAAAHADNPFVKGIGLTAGTAEAFGATLYFGGALTQETAMMALGSNIARYAGGVGLTAVSGYTFIRDVERGDVRDAIGSGANTATGITMLVTSNPYALVATGTFATSYNASRWIAKETGWGEASGKAGAGVANFIMGDDPGTLREGAGYTAGFVVTAGGVLIVEPTVWAGKKIGQGASWAYDEVTDVIGYELYWPF